MSSDSQRPRKTLERLDDGRPRFHGCSRITEYDYICKLGEGTFGEVSKAKSKSSGQIVALKKILMHNEKDGFPITALREIKLLKQLDHVNVLKLDEMVVERPKNAAKKPSLYMVTPYMDHDLSGLLENPDVHFTIPQIKCYMKQLLQGCAYLHKERILHRDMKAANLLINNRGVLQIADFGLARPYDDEPPKPGQGGGEATREYTTLVVTRWYRPPELLLQLRKYTTAIDMWGVGCVFGEMFKHKPILTGETDQKQAELIFALLGNPNEDNMPGWRDLPGAEAILEFPHTQPTIDRQFRELDPLALSLLKELLKLDWRKRVNAMDALDHPYFHTKPLPAVPGDLPSFEDSHELDRKKFRDQKSKRPPAPAGGSVGIGEHGEWGIGGRPLPDYGGRGHGPGPRVPGGRPPHANGHNNHSYNRRHPGPPGGGYGNGGDYRGPNTYSHAPRDMQRDMPPYDQGHRPPPYDDPYPRRPPPPDTSLPPRPPQSDTDTYRYPPADMPPYRDGPPPRQRVPPSAGGGRIPPGGERDTYIPSYSKADPNAAPPQSTLRRGRDDRDDRPPYREPPPDYGEPIRYDDRPPPPPRDIPDQHSHQHAQYNRRTRSRSPIRDRDRDPRRDWDRDPDRERHYRDRDRELPSHRDRGYPSGGGGSLDYRR